MPIKKAFFLVNDLQEHYWNLELSLIIANLLRNKGWEIGFGVHRTEVLMDMSHIYNIYFLPFKSPFSWKSLFRKSTLEYRFSDLRKTDIPIFWIYDNIKFRILEEGYLNSRIVQSQFHKIVKKVKKWKPDILIGAEHFLTHFIGKMLNLPVIQLVKHNAVPGYLSKLRTHNCVKAKTTMDILQVFEPVFNITGGSAINDIHQMLLGDGYIIPGISDFQPVVTNNPYLFIGIHKEINWDERLLRYDKKKRNNKIFINFQKISKPLNYKAYYDLLFSVAQQLKSQFIVSDPTGVVSRYYLRKNYSNISIMKWINNPLVFPYLDLVIHAGDDKNLYDSLYWGVPQLVIPFESEQENKGKWIEELSIGKMQKSIDEKGEVVIVTTPSSDYNMKCNFNLLSPESQLVSDISNICSDPSYLNNCIKQKDLVRSAFDPEKIINFLRNFV